MFCCGLPNSAVVRRLGRAERRVVAAVVRVVEQIEHLGRSAAPSAVPTSRNLLGHAQIDFVERHSPLSALRGMTVPDCDHGRTLPSIEHGGRNGDRRGGAARARQVQTVGAQSCRTASSRYWRRSGCRIRRNTTPLARSPTATDRAPTCAPCCAGNRCDVAHSPSR